MVLTTNQHFGESDDKMLAIEDWISEMEVYFIFENSITSRHD